MNHVSENMNRQLTEAAFSRQSVKFDSLYSKDTIIQYKRKRVREHVLSVLKEKAKILELNAGTGEDALFFSAKGHSVHATDIAAGMIDQLKQKIALGLHENITTQQLSFTELHRLSDPGPYDLIFSDFGGLNCTGELDKVLSSFKPLCVPGGIITLVIIPKFCLWETLLFFKGQFRTAFRRFFSRNGRHAHIEGVHFTCWYYSPKYIIEKLRDDFELVKLEGLCTIVPPSYMEGFAEKYPRLYQFLVRKEDQLKNKRPWRSVGDYFIISMRRTG